MAVKGIKDIKTAHDLKGVHSIKGAKDIGGVSDHKGLSQLQKGLKEAGETLQRKVQMLQANLQTGVNRFHDKVGHQTEKISQSLKKGRDQPHHLEAILVCEAVKAEGKAIAQNSKRRMSNAGIAWVDPAVESFSHVGRTPRGSVVEEEWEPLVDVFNEKDRVVVIVAFPLGEAEHIRTQVNGDILTLSAANGGRTYYLGVVLPKETDVNTFTRTYTNGVLEIRMSKK